MLCNKEHFSLGFHFQERTHGHKTLDCIIQALLQERSLSLKTVFSYGSLLTDMRSTEGFRPSFITVYGNLTIFLLLNDTGYTFGWYNDSSSLNESERRSCMLQ